MCSIDDKIKELESKLDNMKYYGVHGAMVDRYITCGKEGCKCLKGYKHGPYPHIQVYDNKNKLHGIYIGNKKVDKYNEYLENDKIYLELLKEINKLYLEKKNKN